MVGDTRITETPAQPSPEAEPEHLVVEDQLPEAEYTYQRANGTVERAASAEDAIRRCPVLGNLALKAPGQANLLLEMVAAGQKRLAEKAAVTEQPPRQEESTAASPFESSRTAPKLRDFFAAAQASRSPSDTMVDSGAVPVRLTPRDLAELSHREMLHALPEESTVDHMPHDAAEDEAAAEQPILKASTTSESRRSDRSEAVAVEELVPASVAKDEKANIIQATEKPAIGTDAVPRDPVLIPRDPQPPAPVSRVEQSIESLPEPSKAAAVVCEKIVFEGSEKSTTATVKDKVSPVDPGLTVSDTETTKEAPTENKQPASLPDALAASDAEGDQAEESWSLETLYAYQKLAEAAAVEAADSASQVFAGQITEAATVNNVATRVLDFPKLVEAQPTDEEPLKLEVIQAQAVKQPVEQTIAQLAKSLSVGPLRQATAVETAVGELRTALADEQLEEKKQTITPEITEKILDLLRSVGYQNPRETLVGFVAVYDTASLLNMLKYLCQLQHDDNRLEFLMPLASLSDKPQADDMPAFRPGKALLALISQLTTEPAPSY